MNPTLELDIEMIPASDPALDGSVSLDAMRAMEEKATLTPGTVNTYGVGINACPACC